MSRDILQDIINDFQIDKFTHFFRSRINKFYNLNEILDYKDDNFENGKKLGGIDFEDGNIVVCAFQVNKELSERSGKKAQYELGKKILKENRNDAGIFIFYDKSGNFRFSLIYVNYLGRRREWSSFRRFTYYVSKYQTNKTFLQRIGDGDLSSLENIKNAFSVEPLQEEFYKEIQTWFFGVLDKVYFPDNQKERIPLHIIRLLSRLIFIWFIKQNGLIPENIFDEKELKKIVKDFYISKESYNYYNAILQNLFFATLNQPVNQRDWAYNNGFLKNKNNYGIKTFYRYEDKFLISPDKVKEIFSQVPFINGGLFDCLDKDDIGGEVIDGFSRNGKKQARIPDYVFFANSFSVDIKNYEIYANNARGLIKILKNYNFTNDEATPIDQEIALDPELLGKIFENLLAAYNPDTGETARKATGSYYTPREIVDYMVHQSLLEYFKIQFPQIPEEKLDLILSYKDEALNLSEDEKEKIVNCISKIKIIDPACGSGAFLIGALNKLVYVLNKIDSNNNYWKNLQIKKIINEIKQVAQNVDNNEKSRLLDEIKEIFDENLRYPDYARKLYLIENCIYGVDIQEIAVQLSKLRFFISLIIDQKVDKSKENLGIIPLPNLDIKYIAGNTLIGLERLDGVNKLLIGDERIRNKLDAIKEKYHSYFRTRTRKEKINLQNNIKKLQSELASIVSNTLKEKEIQQLEEYEKNIKNIKEEIEKIKREPEQITIVEEKNLFGEVIHNRIDHKAEKIREKEKTLKEYEREKNKLQEFISGDELEKIAKKIAAFNPFDQNYSHGWFDPEWMFGVEGGFDIVIANPPYISTKGISEMYKEVLEQQFGFADDFYNHFYFKGMQLLKEKGILAFISSKTFWTIQTKKNLRELLLKNKLLQLVDTANPFESAMVDTCITIVQKTQSDNHIIKFIDAKNGFDKKQEYKVEAQVYKNVVNNVFFIPSEFNLKVYERLGKTIKTLMDKWWDKISTSKNIEKYKRELEQYRQSLKPGDITLLGLITEGGQGLATANNGKYVGVLEGTKWADNVRKQRPEKLLQATAFCKNQGIKTKADAQAFLQTLSEKEIRQLFDELKEKYGRDVFGQGWLFRIVSPDEIADVDTLTEDEKLNGISGDKTFVPYDKGDKDGNRWYAPTPYYIDWSRENVKFLKENSGKKGEGMPVVRNPQFYFREGFCWNLINATRSSVDLKVRWVEKSIYDVGSMRLMSNFILTPNYYIVCILNSRIENLYAELFLNFTLNFQINDARQLPIIIPTSEQLKEYEDIFHRAVLVQKQKFAGKISEQEAEEKLEEIQRELDGKVVEMYGMK
ncbi:MAG: Eco57I restriction-modification methylase domain-containing protein [Verrucomicrobiia bacterium]